MNDVYCSDQFDNLHIKSSSEGTVVTGPCCNTIGHAVDPRSFDYLTDPYLLRIRQDTAKNQRSPACANCWNHEDAGGLSRRLNGRNDPTKYQGIGIRKLDYTTQNICNLACVHCSPFSSSLWAKLLDDQSLNQEESYYDKISMLRDLDLGKIEHIHITGGEPLMTKEHVKLLGMIRDRDRLNQITLSYNTNCTVMPDPEVIDLWRQVIKVNLIASIDAIGPAAEIIRWPCEWSHVDRVVRDMAELRTRSLPNLTISLNVSVANYNFLELPDIVDWVNSIDPNIFINWQLVNQEHMHPSSLPLVHWHQSRAVTNCHPGLREWYKSFEDESNRSELHWWTTTNWLDRLDRQRGHDWRSVLRAAGPT